MKSKNSKAKTVQPARGRKMGVYSETLMTMKKGDTYEFIGAPRSVIGSYVFSATKRIGKGAKFSTHENSKNSTDVTRVA